ncbi:MAG: helix-hairpin-helix domain-containing protein [Deltaproteobacteria bacterium]|nr:helix-hairpin-helix domain-containing protein [Deltaproteobacteria bacterium]
MTSTMKKGVVASIVALGIGAFVASPDAARGAEEYGHIGSFYGSGAMERVNLNTAGIELLSMTPGVGRTLAVAIVTYRDQNGSFASVDDLLKIRGVGERELKALRNQVTVQ